MKLIGFRDLVAMKVINSKRTLSRIIDTEDFPTGFRTTPNWRMWNEEDVTAWIAARPTARKPVDPQDRCLIYELRKVAGPATASVNGPHGDLLGSNHAIPYQNPNETQHARKACRPGQIAARTHNSLKSIDDRLGSILRDIAAGISDRDESLRVLIQMIERAGLAADAKGAIENEVRHV